MKIQVLGSGCATCKTLFELTKKAVSELGISVEVKYVTDIQKLLETGVMQSPVLAIDGKPVIYGFVPKIEEIKKVITSGTLTGSQFLKCNGGGNCK